MKWLRKLLGLQPYDPWEYGICNGTRARRHKKKGNVQMVLWPAGTHGHIEDYWHNFDSSWWPLFTLDGKNPWVRWSPINLPYSSCDLELMILGEGGKTREGRFYEDRLRFADSSGKAIQIQNIYAWRYKANPVVSATGSELKQHG